MSRDAEVRLIADMTRFSPALECCSLDLAEAFDALSKLMAAIESNDLLGESRCGETE